MGLFDFLIDPITDLLSGGASSAAKKSAKNQEAAMKQQKEWLDKIWKYYEPDLQRRQQMQTMLDPYRNQASSWLASMTGMKTAPQYPAQPTVPPVVAPTPTPTPSPAPTPGWGGTMPGGWAERFKPWQPPVTGAAAGIGASPNTVLPWKQPSAMPTLLPKPAAGLPIRKPIPGLGIQPPVPGLPKYGPIPGQPTSGPITTMPVPRASAPAPVFPLQPPAQATSMTTRTPTPSPAPTPGWGGTMPGGWGGSFKPWQPPTAQPTPGAPSPVPSAPVPSAPVPSAPVPSPGPWGAPHVYPKPGIPAPEVPAPFIGEFEPWLQPQPPGSEPPTPDPRFAGWAGGTPAPVPSAPVETPGPITTMPLPPLPAPVTTPSPVPISPMAGQTAQQQAIGAAAPTGENAPPWYFQVPQLAPALQAGLQGTPDWQNPFTPQQAGALTNLSDVNISDQYNQRNAALQQSLAQRGLAPVGGTSSADISGQIGMQNWLQRQQANQQSQMALAGMQRGDQLRSENLANLINQEQLEAQQRGEGRLDYSTLLNFLTGQTAAQPEPSALYPGVSAYGNMAGQYGNMAGMYGNLAGQSMQGWAQLLAGLGGGGGRGLYSGTGTLTGQVT